MRRSRLRLTIYVTSAVLAAGGGVGAAFAATAPAAKPAAAGLTATFSKDSDWGSGYQGRFTIANRGGASATSWKVQFTLPAGATLGSVWDASVTRSGNTVVAADRGYNATVAAGSITSFGFIVNGSGAPTACTINGTACTGVDNAPPPGPAPSSAAPPPAPAPAPSKTKPTKPAPAPAPAAGGVLVAPYADMGLTSNGGSLQQLAAGSGLKSVTMAFVTSLGCKASWFNSFDPRTGQFSDQINAIRKAGGDVKISFGGAIGQELAAACTSVDALETEYQAVISAYNLKFMDMDIEGAAVADAASISRRSQALAALQKKNPGLRVSLTLPVLPEGLTQDGLNVVKSAQQAGVKIDLVNIMAMDYGRANQEYGQLAIQAVKSTQAQLKTALGLNDAEAFRILGVTPMLGENDDHGIFTIKDAQDLVRFANDSHIGYMGYWEANRDKNACTGAVFQCTNVTQTPFEFGKIFGGFHG